MLKKIAFAVQRYGVNVNGGAEYHCRVLAEHMLKKYDVDVITSCANGYTPWDNYYNEGYEEINGVNVIRFKVEKKRDDIVFAKLSQKIKNGDQSIEEEWISELGPYCPGAIEYIKDNASKYKAVIFFTYQFYITVMGMKLGLNNAILLPTAHDEPTIYYNIYRTMFRSCQYLLYNSIEEREFLIKAFDLKEKKSRLNCVGIDIPALDEQSSFVGRQYGNYIVYIGRVSYGKNYSELNKFFVEYKKRNSSDLKLIVIGKADNGMKIKCSDDIIYTGFVTDDERNDILSNAKLLIMPSRFESLSLVILESMALKKPILVNGNCAVLKGQCMRSNGGLYYENYYEFEAALNYILNNKKAYGEMCENGYEFVTSIYNWDAIVENVASLIEELEMKI